MFRKERIWSEADFRAMRALGDTDAGRALSEFVQQEVEGAVDQMMYEDAADVASVAYMQAATRFGQQIWFLLNGDIEAILEEQNIETGEDDAGNTEA